MINGVTDLDSYEKYYYIAIFGIPCIISAAPFITDDYGVSGLSSWISNGNKSALEQLLWRLGLFYIPLWLSIIFNFVSYFRIYKFVKALFDGS